MKACYMIVLCFELNVHFVGWITTFSEDCQVLRLCKFKCSDTTAKVNFCVAVRPDLSLILTYCDNTIEPVKCTVLKRIDQMMNSGM